MNNGYMQRYAKIGEDKNIKVNLRIHSFTMIQLKEHFQ